MKDHTFVLIYPLCCWWLIWPLQNDAKKNLKNNWNPGTWVLIWEYLSRPIQWIPAWQGFNGFQKTLRPCTLDKVASALEGLTLWICQFCTFKRQSFLCEKAIALQSNCPSEHRNNCFFSGTSLDCDRWDCGSGVILVPSQVTWRVKIDCFILLFVQKCNFVRFNIDQNCSVFIEVRA